MFRQIDRDTAEPPTQLILGRWLDPRSIGVESTFASKIMLSTVCSVVLTKSMHEFLHTSLMARKSVFGRHAAIPHIKGKLCILSSRTVDEPGNLAQLEFLLESKAR